ncbi:hypothetical protein BC629DRAFT_399265 [Irpex lacteus]|nr:hypothetical protein BC629DRAFT_399265 [Irpex lacteus]
MNTRVVICVENISYASDGCRHQQSVKLSEREKRKNVYSCSRRTRQSVPLATRKRASSPMRHEQAGQHKDSGRLGGEDNAGLRVEALCIDSLLGNFPLLKLATLLILGPSLSAPPSRIHCQSIGRTKSSLKEYNGGRRGASRGHTTINSFMLSAFRTWQFIVLHLSRCRSSANFTELLSQDEQSSATV